MKLKILINKEELECDACGDSFKKSEFAWAEQNGTGFYLFHFKSDCMISSNEGITDEVKE